MTGGVKLTIAGACSVGAGGAGLVGSNYAITKETSTKITDTNSKEWDTKVTALFTKVKANNPTDLKSKIEATATEHSGSLTIENNNNAFKTPDKAKKALQAWCAKSDTKDKELCEITKKQGWLF